MNHQLTDPRSSLNSKEDKYKENHTSAHHSQTAGKNKDEENIFKATEEEKNILVIGKSSKNNI